MEKRCRKTGYDEPLQEFLREGGSNRANYDVSEFYRSDSEGRGGGFLVMEAFLSSTADNPVLPTTQRLHRAVCLMDNFLGIHPSPPPAGVDITEPDVRTACTIRED